MNKSESKYFNTAVRMDNALISLLKKKPLEYITVSELWSFRLRPVLTSDSSGGRKFVKGGSSVDGVDMYLMVAMAESLGMNADFHDAKYADAYQAVKNGDGEILATAVVLTEQVKADFKVSDVYAKGKIQILCDEG